MKLTNYHTHTWRCFHAAQVCDKEYVENAIKAGFSVLGFSDHTPWPYASGYVSENERMSVSQLDGYFSSVLSLKEEYADRIEIRIGLECEYLAHPELPFANHMEFDEEAQACARMICREAKAIGMPLEYNLYGTVKQEQKKQKGLGYPAKEFWQVASEFGCAAIVGVDAHKPEHMLDVERYLRARAYLESLNVKVIEEL